jgi:hypothetical protein
VFRLDFAVIGYRADIGNRRATERKLMGMSKTEIYGVLTSAGFTNIRHYSFGLGLKPLHSREQFTAKMMETGKGKGRLTCSWHELAVFSSLFFGS